MAEVLALVGLAYNFAKGANAVVEAATGKSIVGHCFTLSTCLAKHFTATSISGSGAGALAAGSGLAAVGTSRMQRRKSQFIGAASYHRASAPGDLVWSRVVLTGLESNPDMNGSPGVVISWKEFTGRYSVKLDDRGHREFSVRPENLTPTGEATAIEDVEPMIKTVHAVEIDTVAVAQPSAAMHAALAASLSACADSLAPLQGDHPAAEDPNVKRQLATLLQFLQELATQIGGLDVLTTKKRGNIMPTDKSQAALARMHNLQGGLIIALQLNTGLAVAAGSALSAVRNHKAADPPELPEVVQEMLRNPSKSYTLEQKIECITACIREGDDAAMEAHGEDIVVILGNTGAGKSTFVNWLHGCKMQQVKKNKVPGLKGTGKVVIVAPGTEPTEIMAIGHSKASMTFIPGIQRDSNFVYVDCPGFLDNRGSSVNVANATNIKLTVSRAKTVKVRRQSSTPRIHPLYCHPSHNRIVYVLRLLFCVTTAT